MSEYIAVKDSLLKLALARLLDAAAFLDEDSLQDALGDPSIREDRRAAVSRILKTAELVRSELYAPRL